MSQMNLIEIICVFNYVCFIGIVIIIIIQHNFYLTEKGKLEVVTECIYFLLAGEIYIYIHIYFATLFTAKCCLAGNEIFPG